MRGQLTIVGTGIQVGLDTTIEARFHIESAQKVLYLVADALTAAWIDRLNPTAESLARFYEPAVSRMTIYDDMVGEILLWLRKSRDLCVAFYGHPGFYVYPSHEAIRRARREGFRASLLPGVSALDRLFSDLGIDPGEQGYQSYEATNFLICRRTFDTSTALILLQVGVLGVEGWHRTIDPGRLRRQLSVLSRHLRHHYDADHEVIVYEASPYPVTGPVVQRVSLDELPSARITPLSTLYVPPGARAIRDPDRLRELHLALSLSPRARVRLS